MGSAAHWALNACWLDEHLIFVLISVLLRIEDWLINRICKQGQTVHKIITSGLLQFAESLFSNTDGMQTFGEVIKKQ